MELLKEVECAKDTACAGSEDGLDHKGSIVAYGSSS